MSRSSRKAPRRATVRSSRNGGRGVFDRSSGNVYRDLGFSAAEAEYLWLRSRLMLIATRLIHDKRLTQSAAAQLFGVSQPRVSDVVRGRIERLTIDALVEMLARARRLGRAALRSRAQRRE